MESYRLNTDRGPGLINYQNNAKMVVWSMLKYKCFENRQLRGKRIKGSPTEGIFYPGGHNKKETETKTVSVGIFG